MAILNIKGISSHALGQLTETKGKIEESVGESREKDSHAVERQGRGADDRSLGSPPLGCIKDSNIHSFIIRL